MSEPPIACTLSAAELQERRAGLLPGLLARAVERVPVSNGYRWRFTAAKDLLSALAPVIEAERDCCRFLRFVVAAEPDGGPISLEVTGPPGTREFLDQLMAGAEQSR
jgi:hypothetical protein